VAVERGELGGEDFRLEMLFHGGEAGDFLSWATSSKAVTSRAYFTASEHM